ncbi:MAG: 50S ribosomal protein L15 [Candidatus Symbiobacter sp.]|nr:50S ribosomal protein L15 [Candidatus Symbiobacter sp.]
MQLNEIKDNHGARRKRTRVGRGIGSGLGKTSGRGVKGQGSRTGVAINGFEGGQMPLHMRLPKRGFKSLFRKEVQIVNLGRLQQAIDAKRLDAKNPLTPEILADAGLVRSGKIAVKLLAGGLLSTKISLTVATASPNAVSAVEKLGGSVTLTSSAA